MFAESGQKELPHGDLSSCSLGPSVEEHWAFREDLAWCSGSGGWECPVPSHVLSASGADGKSSMCFHYC